MFAKEPRHAIDDPIAERVPERIVVPLEGCDIDEPHGAPVPALLEGEKRLELLDEAAEVHQARLRIAVHAIRQVGDQLLEVFRDAAHRCVACRQLLAHLVHPLGEAGRDRLNRVLLRLLPQTLVLQEDVVDRVEQGMFLMSCQVELLPDPLMQLGPC